MKILPPFTPFLKVREFIIGTTCGYFRDAIAFNSSLSGGRVRCRSMVPKKRGVNCTFTTHSRLLVCTTFLWFNASLRRWNRIDFLLHPSRSIIVLPLFSVLRPYRTYVRHIPSYFVFFSLEAPHLYLVSSFMACIPFV